jgi:hypothetical protein
MGEIVSTQPRTLTRLDWGVAPSASRAHVESVCSRVEKLAPGGDDAARVGGVSLIGLGVWLLAK